MKKLFYLFIILTTILSFSCDDGGSNETPTDNPPSSVFISKSIISPGSQCPTGGQTVWKLP